MSRKIQGHFAPFHTENYRTSIAPHHRSVLSITEYQSNAFYHSLLPLLKHLSGESRWQLWVTQDAKLDKKWARQNELPIEKTMQMVVKNTLLYLATVIKALKSGNYSVVIMHHTDALNTIEKLMLESAAQDGQSTLIVLHNTQKTVINNRHTETIKIPNTWFH